MATEYHTVYVWAPGDDNSWARVREALEAAGMKYEIESTDTRED